MEIQTERRAAPRLAREECVEITILSTNASGDVTLRGRLRDLSPQGCQIETDVAIAMSAPLRIVMSDRLILGEVMYCRVAANDARRFAVGVAADQMLTELASLARLARTVWSESRSLDRGSMPNRRAVS